MSIEQYRLNESKAVERLAEWQDVKDSVSLKREIALLRLLLEQAAQQNSPGLCQSLASSIGQLVKVDRIEAQRRGELLPLAVAIRLGHELGPIIAEVLNENGVYGFEGMVDEIQRRQAVVVERIRREAATVAE